jgi:AraC-like DNA-binding protein
MNRATSRVGVGERQLRRLFHQHLGASPIAVAQTRRVLLAKQLIHETHLPMTEIAMAAGFGSLRRFNETFLALFRRPPTALRRAVGADVTAGVQGEVSLLLRYRPPYDWPAMLGFLRARAIAGVESVEGGVYRRTIGLDGLQGTVAVRATDGDALRATVCFPRLSILPKIIGRLRRVFDLAADPDAIAVHLAKDPALEPLVAARPGLRVPGAWDGFELAVRAVLGPRNSSGRQAGRPIRRTVAQFRPDAELRLPGAQGTGRRKSVDPRYAPAARRYFVGRRRGGRRRPASLRCWAEPSGGRYPAAHIAGNRRMDGPIHRDASAT